MSFQWKLLILILALYLEDQVHGGRIYGGHEAKPHSRPYMVLVENLKDGITGHCGGFLLNESFVMTAAHCQADSYTVLLGLHNYNNRKNVQTLSVEEAIPHKNYNPTTYKNDIMYLKLKSKANFNEYVKSIAMADQDNGSLPKSCIVSGWGRSNKHNGYMSTVLMEVNVKLIDDEYCTQMDTYCSEGETGPGEGDSGGPLVCEDGKAYGVVSRKENLTNGRVLKLYTKIPENKSWISLAMKTATKRP